MSYSVCPFCGGMLTGYPGSPCTEPTCINSVRAPVTPVTSTPDQPVTVDRARKTRRRSARLARRKNRRKP